MCVGAPEQAESLPSADLIETREKTLTEHSLVAQRECLLAEVVRSLGFRHESRTLAVSSHVHGPSFTENQLLVRGLCTKGIYLPSDGGFRFLKSLTTNGCGAGSIWPSEVCGPRASRAEHDLDFKEKESEGGQEGCEFLRWEPSRRGA